MLPAVGPLTLAKVGNEIIVQHAPTIGATQYKVRWQWYGGSTARSGPKSDDDTSTVHHIRIEPGFTRLEVNVTASDNNGNESPAPSVGQWEAKVAILPKILGYIKRALPWLAILGLIAGVIMALPWVIKKSKAISSDISAAVNTPPALPLGTNNTTGVNHGGLNNGPTGINPNAANAVSAPANYTVNVYGDISDDATVVVANGNQNANNVLAGGAKKPRYKPALPNAPEWTNEEPSEVIAVPPVGWDPNKDLECRLEPNNRTLYQIDPTWNVEVVGDCVKFPMMKVEGNLHYNDHPGYVGASGQVGLSLGVSALYLEPMYGRSTVHLRFHRPNNVGP